MSNRVGPIVLVVIGTLLLLNNLNILRLHDYAQFVSTWWPAILIAVGVAGLTGLGGKR